MLKLVTQPRSRRKREWWRATPGRSGACSVPPPPPPKAPPIATKEACRGSEGGPEPAVAAARARADRARSGDTTRAHGGHGSRRPSLLWRRLENGLAAVTGAPENYGSHRAECWVSKKF